MGIRLPQPIEYCPWDNPNWPPGQTPRFFYASVGGVKLGTWWNPPLPYPPNDVFTLEQRSEYEWYRLSGPYELILIINYFILIFTIKTVPGNYMCFDSQGLYPFAFFYESLNVIPGDFYWGGSVLLAPQTELDSRAADLNISTAQKTFAELQGRDVRLAQRAQGTCVYYRKV